MIQNYGSDSDTFFEEQSKEILQAVCRGVGGETCPAAYVSGQLIVLGQTASCGSLLADASFYSLEGILKEEYCALVRRCIAEKLRQSQTVYLADRYWEMHVEPTGVGAVLVFLPDTQGLAGVTMAGAELRDRASSLLLQASRLDGIEQPELAAELRQEAYRILRAVSHLELLAGVPDIMQWNVYNLHTFLYDTQEQLEKQGAPVRVVCPEADVTFPAEARLLRMALLSLVSNSLRHGGASDVCLSASVEEKSITFHVDDDGTGIPAEVMRQMSETWRRTDALPGGWGLGIPYARRIAALHAGILVFVQEGAGAHARLRIPRQRETPEALESGGMYQTVIASGVSEADIELSAALPASCFRKDRAQT